MYASTLMLVPAAWLGRVAGLNQALGALSLAVLPFHGALMIDVVTALLAVALMLPFRIPQPQPDRTQRWSLWGDFVAGVQVVTMHRGLLALYTVVTLMVI